MVPSVGLLTATKTTAWPPAFTVSALGVVCHVSIEGGYDGVVGGAVGSVGVTGGGPTGVPPPTFVGTVVATFCVGTLARGFAGTFAGVFVTGFGRGRAVRPGSRAAMLR